MKNIRVRDSKKEDMEQVLQLIRELAVFEREPKAVAITVNDLKQHGFGSQAAFHCFVAEVNDTVEGMALIYPKYSTWKGKIIHLEDLIVRENMRGKGIGSALLDAVIVYGHKKRAKRIDWNVLNWNTPAITFYESNGAQIRKDWSIAQLDEQGIKNYISKIH